MNKLVKTKLCVVITGLILAGGFTTASAVAPPAVAPPGSTLAQRLDQRKAERGIVLNEVDLERLTQTCVSVQSKLRLIQRDTVSMLENHSRVYKKIDARLWVTIGQLKLADQDTFQLEKQRIALTDKVASFQSLAMNYQQVLDDILVINCQADPTGFQALLDTARIYHTQLRTQSADIHDYLINSIKATLASHVSDLQTKPATNGGN